jgi:hypothetical protein
MNEQIITEMKAFFEKMRGTRDKTRNELVEEMKKKILRDLEAKNPGEVLDFIRTNWMRDSSMVGPHWMAMFARQVYPKLLKLSKEEKCE